MIDKPSYMSVPTFRNYEDYHDAEQYVKGWNDAMDFIFQEPKKARANFHIYKEIKGQKDEKDN